MKSMITSFFILLLVTTLSAESQNPVTEAYTLAEQSTMTVEGTSTIHDWELEVKDLSTSVALNPELLQNEQPASPVSNVSLTVPVKKMDSGKGGMNRKIYGALKEDEHPNITFSLDSTELATPPENGSFTLNVSGNLTIAGHTRAISLPVTGTLTEEGNLRFAGSYKLNMTDYKVDPPTAVFGTIRSGEEVTIKFDLLFAKQ